MFILNWSLLQASAQSLATDEDIRANAQQILADYDDYFGYAFPLPKLDSIAIPGGFSGAMENWGAITYTDATLLLSHAS